MAKRKIFYSFHFDNDVMRVQQVRNMGVVEGNEPVRPNPWEEVKGRGRSAVELWIDDNMRGKDCCICLIGAETASRPWVDYEIKKAWRDGLGLFAIHIHNLTAPRIGTSRKGANPLAGIVFTERGRQVIPACYDPSSADAYGDIAQNLSRWVEEAIKQRR